MEILRKFLFPLVLGSGALGISFFVMAGTPAERYILLTEAVKDIGIVIIGLSVVQFVWWLFGGDPNEIAIRNIVSRLDVTTSDLSRIATITASARRTGLLNVGENQDALGYPPSKLVADINNATDSIDMMGVVLNIIHSHDRVIAAIKSKASTNCPIRILVSSPKSPFLDAIFDKQYNEEIVTGSNALVNKLRPMSDKIQVRTLDMKVIALNIIRVDDYMIVSPYLHSTQSTDAPRLSIQGASSPLYTTYKAEFDALFSLGTPI